MTKLPPAQPPHELTAHLRSGFYRRVSVQGSEEIAATVIVKTIQGNVWLSIMPPFTWEAVMTPAEVDELTHVLSLARQDAAARTGWPPSPNKAAAKEPGKPFTAPRR